MSSIETTTSFNTQPPEGGWLHFGERVIEVSGFNTQPPEGGWFRHDNIINNI